jgi:nicotinate-nucleotide adenylyltransferase
LSSVLVYGGAFNPPTIAHIETAAYARKESGYDKVIFVPTKMTYIRSDQHKDYAFSDEERLAMLRKTAETRNWMQVSDYEINSEEQPRTLVTLRHLSENYDHCSLLFGSDKLKELETGWMRADLIAKEYGIWCMSRNGDHCEAIIDNDPYLSGLKQYIHIIHLPEKYQDISSSKVRKLLKEHNYNEAMKLMPEELHGLINEV